MTPLHFTLTLLLFAYAAGLLGSLAGLGGGIIVVPALSMVLGVDIKNAIAASIVAVVATSITSSAVYVRNGMTNLRVAMLLELSTVTGALCGALLGGFIPERFLYLVFACVLSYAGWSMWRRPAAPAAGAASDPLAERLNLHGDYQDAALGRRVAYQVRRTKLGLAVSWVAGVISGLLGVGGGALNVPVMNVGMGMPIKVSSATSSFMIGVTAATGAAIYFMRGQVLPFIAAPVVIGVLFGAKTGTRLMGRIKGQWIRAVFMVVIAVTVVEMLAKGIR